jgi:hypothetical protein
LAAIEPSVPTVTPWPAKNALPSEFVWAGPKKLSNSSVGWAGSAASSSERFGKRAGAGGGCPLYGAAAMIGSWPAA